MYDNNNNNNNNNNNTNNNNDNNNNICLGMLNRKKPHLNRFGAIQLVKNYREILKTSHHKEKPANESVPILKPVGPSSPCKTVKNSKISDNQLNTIQENQTDFIRNLKLSSRHEIALGLLNVNCLRNKFETIADVIQEHLTFFFYQKLKLTKVSRINSFVQITLEHFGKIENGMGEGSCFM